MRCEEISEAYALNKTNAFMLVRPKSGIRSSLKPSSKGNTA